MKPGLYVATVRKAEGVTVWRDEVGDYMVVSGPDSLPVVGDSYAAHDVTDARPLVVLDPESDEDVARFRSAILDYGNGGTARHILRTLAAPAPAEPMGLGAVVRDADGRLWTLIDVELHDWHSKGAGRGRIWREIDSPEVLSEGVTP